MQDFLQNISILRIIGVNHDQGCTLISLRFILMSALTSITHTHTHSFLLLQLGDWDLEFDGFQARNPRVSDHLDMSRLKMLGVRVCVWCTLPYFSLPLIGRSVCSTRRTLLSNIKDVI